MKTHNLLMTTMLSTGFLLGAPAFSLAADNIAAATVSTSNAPVNSETFSDPRLAAQRFIAHVNYARVALAMKNGELARQHVTQARNMIVLITSSTAEQRRVTHVSAGRVHYTYDTIHKYNYFPIETGPIKIKEVSDGPIWAENSLAVTDAEIVNLTLDLTDDKAETYLAQADADISAGKLMDAAAKLGELTDAVVSIDEKVSVPIDKAHDNISIAQSFLRGKNYDGARFALNHADDALDEMQKNDIYKTRVSDIIKMRKEVKDMREITTKKDPTLIEKSTKTLDNWMTDLKAWAKKE